MMMVDAQGADTARYRHGQGKRRGLFDEGMMAWHGGRAICSDPCGPACGSFRVQ
jgi:hypothetical protein